MRAQEEEEERKIGKVRGKKDFFEHCSCVAANNFSFLFLPHPTIIFVKGKTSFFSFLSLMLLQRGERTADEEGPERRRKKIAPRHHLVIILFFLAVAFARPLKLVGGPSVKARKGIIYPSFA